MAPKFSIIIPAYNEEKTVARAIRETAAVFDPLKEEYEIIVVDDGSADRTAEEAEKLVSEHPSLALVAHETNRGKGEAVRTGVNAAAGEYAVFIDADLATHPSEIMAFLPRLGANKILIGSRTAAGAVISRTQPAYRVWGGRFINLLVRKIVGLPFRDTQCGFKMFDLAAGKKIFAEMPDSRWLFDIDLLARAVLSGCEIVELPVRWTDGATSRLKLFDVVKELPRLWRIRRLVKQAKKDQTE
jgi:glycosyltransferase involved in cell wall biosynthesis